MTRKRNENLELLQVEKNASAPTNSPMRIMF